MNDIISEFLQELTKNFSIEEISHANKQTTKLGWELSHEQ